MLGTVGTLGLLKKPEDCPERYSERWELLTALLREEVTPFPTEDIFKTVDTLGSVTGYPSKEPRIFAHILTRSDPF